MAFNVFEARKFLEMVEWATASNLSYLFYGTAEKNRLIYTRDKIYKMTLTKRVQPVRILPCPFERIYADPNTKKNRINEMLYHHDRKLRDAVGKYIFHYGGFDELEITQGADAKIGNIAIEMDNGNMTPRQLREKIQKNYVNGSPVIFFMASPYRQHWRTAPQILQDEQNRLKKLFKIVSEELPRKPSKILGAGHFQFLRDGLLHNFKGEVNPWKELQ